MTLRSLARGAALAASLAVLNPWLAEAQRPRVSPFLPDDHWALEIARTLDARGLMPVDYDAGTRRQTAGEVWRGLEAAAESSPLARDALARLVEELGPEWGRAGLAWAAGLDVGLGSRAGDVLAGRGNHVDDWIGPYPLEDHRGGRGGATFFGRFHVVAAGFDGRLDAGGARLTDAYALVGAGPVDLWVGAMTDGFRAGPVGSLVVTATEPGPGLGLAFREGLHLPGFLAHLGPVRFTTHLYRAGANGSFRHPWLWLMRGTVAPHPRVSVGVSRAIMMGGEGNDGPSVQSLAYALIGKHAGGFDNQVVSVNARYRAPTESVLPLVGFLEWGFEDSAGAWRDVPGIIAGIEVPRLPFAPAASAGVARTQLAESCCGNPMWYRNWAFRGGWTDGGVPLGHPLGGHGREWLAFGRVGLAEARVQLDAAGFTRWRGGENLFAPDREGDSRGGRIGVVLLPDADWRLFARGELERGSRGAWREHHLEVGIVARF